MKTAAGWLPALGLALLTFAAYVPATRGRFIWDDDLYAANPILARPDGLRTILTWRPASELYYRDVPGVYATFWLERRLWGLRPEGYHLVNIALHALNAILAWLILRRLRLPGAWLAAAIFALHPLQVESVAWITERKNVLSGFFYLSALAGFLRFEDGDGAAWYAGALALFPLALLSKPVTCTLPLVLILLRWGRGLAIGRRDLVRLLPFFACSVAAGLLTLGVEGRVLGPDVRVSWAQRALVAARAVWFYPMKLAWPAGLTFSYERWNPDVRDPFSWLWVFGTFAAGVWAWRRRDRLGRGFLAAAGFYLLTIAPMLGFVTIYTFRYSFVADHYQYLACLGLIVIGVGAGSRLLRGRGAAGAVAGAAVLLALGLAARSRAGVYRDSISLWSDTAAKNPSSWLAENNLGFALAGQGRGDEAIEHYLRSLRLKGDYAEAHLNLGVALAGKGRAEEAEEQYRAAMRGAPAWPVSRLAPDDLALSLLGRGRTDEAIALYQETLGREPDDAEAHDGLGRAFLGRGRPAEAMFHFQQALIAEPDRPEAQARLGAALAALGLFAEAAAHYREALRLAPGDREARAGLTEALRRFTPSSGAGDDPRAALDEGARLWARGDRAAAAARFRSALEARAAWSPEDAPAAARAHNDLGSFLWERGGRLEALAHYEEAVRLDPTLAAAYDNLGLVLLFQKKNEDAAAYFREAIRRDPGLDDARSNLARALRLETSHSSPQ